MQEGRQMQYADLEETAARRCLTEEEIRWNAALMEQEAEEQRRDSASAATPATPAPDTPPWRRPRVDDAAAMAVDPPPRDRSRSPPRATRAKAAPERPPSPPPRTRLAEAKAAPNDLRGPTAAATVARDPPAATPTAATAARDPPAATPAAATDVFQDNMIAVELSPECIPGLDGQEDSAATAVSQNSSVQETNFPSKAGKHKTIHAFQKDASTMLQLNKKPDHPPPAAATAPWHKRSNGSLSEGATAATKAKSASPREEGVDEQSWTTCEKDAVAWTTASIKGDAG